MKHLKLIRFFSMMAAQAYNLIYLIVLLKWLSLVFWEDEENDKLVTLIIAMNLGYSLVLHWTLVPVNAMIILKEFSMEFV